MSKNEIGHFSGVDKSQDPEVFVRFLEAINQMDVIQELKRQGVALLELNEGDHVLDIGCGLGDVVEMMAEKVGATGRVVGIDQSETMLERARSRCKTSNLPMEFKFCQAQQLDFPDNTFDACRTDRVLMYLEDSRKGLSEMVRVTKPGGRIVNFEPDWETVVLHRADKNLTRRMISFWCDSLPNGWLGRQLSGLHKELGLEQTRACGLTLTLPTYKLFNDLFMVEATVERAKKAGAVSQNEGDAWLNDLKESDKAGSFFFANTGFLVGSRKPN